MDAALHTRRPAAPSGSPLTASACTPAEEVLTGLGSGRTGLAAAEASRRQATYGPNAAATDAARLGPVLWQQLRSPLPGLLVAAAATSRRVRSCRGFAATKASSRLLLVTNGGTSDPALSAVNAVGWR